MGPVDGARIVAQQVTDAAPVRSHPGVGRLDEEADAGETRDDAKWPKQSNLVADADPRGSADAPRAIRIAHVHGPEELIHRGNARESLGRDLEREKLEMILTVELAEQRDGSRTEAAVGVVQDQGLRS